MTANIVISCDGLACRVHRYIDLDALDDFHMLIKEAGSWRYDTASGKHYCSQCDQEIKDEEGKNG